MKRWLNSGKIILFSTLFWFTSGLDFGSPLKLAQPAQADDFNPPDRGLPGRRRGGGTRNAQSSCVSSSSIPLTVLLPESNLGLTTAAYPQIFWFVPQHNASYLEVSLYATNKDFQDENLLFTSQFQTNGQAGIGHFKIPTGINFNPLLEGDTYHWYVSIICNPDDRSSDITVSGWLERVAMPPDLANSLVNATGIDRSKAFAQAGIWYDALEVLTELRCRPPLDGAGIQTQWKALLSDSQVELVDLAEFPWFQNCPVVP